MEDYNLGVLQKFEITVVCGLNFNWYIYEDFKFKISEGQEDCANTFKNKWTLDYRQFIYF